MKKIIFVRQIKRVFLMLIAAQLCYGGVTDLSGDVKTFTTESVSEGNSIRAWICCENPQRSYPIREEHRVTSDYSYVSVSSTLRVKKGTILYYNESGEKFFRYTCEEEDVGHCVLASFGFLPTDLAGFGVKLTCNTNSTINDFWSKSGGYIHFGVEKGTITVDNAPGSVTCGKGGTALASGSKSKGGNKGAKGSKGKTPPLNPGDDVQASAEGDNK